MQPSRRYKDDHRQGARQGQTGNDRSKLWAAVAVNSRKGAVTADSVEAPGTIGARIQAKPAKRNIQLRSKKTADGQRLLSDGTPRMISCSGNH